jgi:hypothetical protein
MLLVADDNEINAAPPTGCVIVADASRVELFPSDTRMSAQSSADIMQVPTTLIRTPEVIELSSANHGSAECDSMLT